MGIVMTLLGRCEKVVTEEEDKIQENETISKALNIYIPHWTITSVKAKKAKKEGKKKVKVEEEDGNRGMRVIGLSERMARVMKKRRINTAM